jgi:hypothetical protein
MKREGERKREALTGRYHLGALGLLPKVFSSPTHAEVNIWMHHAITEGRIR